MWRKRVIFLEVAAILLGAAAWFLFGFRISALQKPGRVESFLADSALEWFVARGANAPLAAAPLDSPENVSAGKAMFVDECGLCHGSLGRRPTEMGRSLHPRAPALDSARVQGWSNRELFWIIKHGIRNTGMPGFARIHSDREIWRLVDYIRSLDRGKSESGL